MASANSQRRGDFIKQEIVHAQVREELVKAHSFRYSAAAEEQRKDAPPALNQITSKKKDAMSDRLVGTGPLSTDAVDKGFKLRGGSNNEDDDITKAVRLQIKRDFPMGSIFGGWEGTPLTMNSVNSELFAGVWGMIREILVASRPTGLNRKAKEEVSSFISRRNECPYCIKAHDMMSTAARAHDSKEQQRREMALAYAAYAYQSLEASAPGGKAFAPPNTITLQLDGSGATAGPPSDEELPRGDKVNVVALILLFTYMNHGVTVLLKDYMMTAMLNVPEAISSVMESPSMMKVMNLLMAPFMRGKLNGTFAPGDSLSLLPDAPLPADMKWAEELPEVAGAIARFCKVMDDTEERLLRHGGAAGVTPRVIKVLTEGALQHGASGRESADFLFEEAAAQAEKERDALNDRERAALRLMLLTACAPHDAREDALDAFENGVRDTSSKRRNPLTDVLVLWAGGKVAISLAARMAKEVRL